eukprot:373738-Prymnesium_polylepis.1
MLRAPPLSGSRSPGMPAVRNSSLNRSRRHDDMMHGYVDDTRMGPRISPSAKPTCTCAHMPPRPQRASKLQDCK